MSQPELRLIFRDCLPFWEGLSEEEKELLVTNSLQQTFKPGSLIPHCTDAANPGVQIITQGRVRAFISSEDGKQFTILRSLKHKYFSIGASCVLDDVVYDVSLEAETFCEIVLIPKAICKRLFETNFLINRATIGDIASKLSHTLKLLQMVTFESPRSRVVNALIEYSYLAGSPVFNVTHEKIALEIGTLREVVSRNLEQLQAEGLITLQRGKIRINNAQNLLKARDTARLHSVTKL